MASSSASVMFLNVSQGMNSLSSCLPPGVTPVRMVLMNWTSVQLPIAPPGVMLEANGAPGSSPGMGPPDRFSP